ncbi:hypothetical protein REJC140_03270 [Pseudorhizobium endolithicum]|uniref:DUF2948 family protein n=1 Tax=Pseudorhizobium endolithicum TaxID=1191678 RepID=A0ABN7JKA9_9HYPH|nr:DUF2948 family protein [Pseudorhizobium endolithicum]CAD7034068.1 hypothetical protein REJC140_03270 [Pseudorhizobium endolithicum]
MADLKLLALDQDDLGIISAHMQDSVFRVGELSYDARHRQFTAVVNRFVWEEADRGKKGYERRRSVISFKRVEAVRSLGVNRQDPEGVYCMLAIRFEQQGDGPDGTVELTLSGGGAISLDVECIEVQMLDTGGAWATERLPAHPAD